MINNNSQLTYEEVHTCALLCKTRTEFKDNYRKVYEYATREGILDQVCSHIKTKAHKSWTDEMLIEEASKYTGRTEFQNSSASAYMLCRKRGLLEEACKHMGRKHMSWTADSLREAALQCGSRTELQENHGGAYYSTVRLGILDEICSHMMKDEPKWTFDKIQEVANRYTGRYEFKLNDGGAYNAAVKLGVLAQVCSHMEYRTCATVLTEPMYLYYVEISHPKLPTVWKIGITKHANIIKGRFGKSLIRECAETEIKVIKTWLYSTGYEAKEKEQTIMSSNKDSKYCGDSPLQDTGNTEMFVEDIFDSVVNITEGDIDG